jgi:hypothetical protein
MYFILIAFLLFAAYTGLLVVEHRRGERYLRTGRVRLDGVIEQGAFILAHVDLASFIRGEAFALARRAAHALARVALTSVRVVEGALTRLVRRLHLHPDIARPASGESARSFVRTLSEFKGQLEATRPSRMGWDPSFDPEIR